MGIQDSKIQINRPLEEKVGGRMEETKSTLKKIPENQLFYIHTTKEEYYPQNDESVHEDALCYQATSLAHLAAIAEYLHMDSDEVFVDLGCGKGRVLCFMAQQPIKKVIGVELRKELVLLSRANIEQLRPRTPVEVVLEDSTTFYTEEGTVYYMFNPFGIETVRSVLENIKRSFVARPRPIRIVYNNCVYGQCIDKQYWLEREGKIGPTGITVWHTK